MTVSVGSAVLAHAPAPVIHRSLLDLAGWLDKNDYRAFDTFDGLNARLLRPLTFNNALLRTVLQQGVRRFPFNIRPLIGVAASRSTKGMGFLARGFLRLYATSGDRLWRDKAERVLAWLLESRSPGYAGACWGNHFDYQSRCFYLPKGTPTIVWTSLIGHAFLDAFQHIKNREYLETAVSSCEHILHDLATYSEGDSLCISYIPTENKQVHNANTLGASLLARTYSLTGTEAYKSLAEKSDSLHSAASAVRWLLVLRRSIRSALD
jgi:hypothetical protein